MSRRWKYLILVGAQGVEYVNHQVSAVARLPNSHPMEYGFVESALNVIEVKRWSPTVGRDRQHRGKGEDDGPANDGKPGATPGPSGAGESAIEDGATKQDS